MLAWNVYTFIYMNVYVLVNMFDVENEAIVAKGNIKTLHRTLTSLV